MNHRKYPVVIEEGAGSVGAYVPDLPGVIAAAATRDEVEKLIAEAIDAHIALLEEQGKPMPRPRDD